MAILVSIFPIFAGLTGLHSLSTVTRVTVEEGGSISIPCFYNKKRTNHVKYLCKGCSWGSCTYEIKTNEENSTKYSIFDDKNQGMVTFIIKALETMDTNCYWCSIEKNFGDLRKDFHLHVAKQGDATLYVDSQEVTGFIGDQLTIYCHYKGARQIKWCRTTDAGYTSCVKNNGWIEGTKVMIGRNTSDIITVTMSGLMKRSGGWYWVTDGELQMPVHVTIKERPPTTTTTTTTTRQSTTVSSTSKPFNHTYMSQAPTTEQTGTHSSSSNHLLPVIIPLCLLLVIVMVVVFIWFMLKRHKSSDTAENDQDVTYSTVTHVGKESSKTAEDEQTVTYSTLMHVRKPSEQESNTKGEADVTYSTVSFMTQQNTHRVEDKDENVTYSTVAHRQ